MISYVECLGGEGAGPGVGSRCWNGVPDEDLDELLPRQIAALQPKTEGSLRRRLLSAKIHQQHAAILGQNATEAHGNRFLAAEAHGNRFLAAEAHGNRYPIQGENRFLATEAHGKPNLHSALSQRGRTGSCPPTPEPRPGYTLPAGPPFGAQSPFVEPEVVPPQYRYRPSRGRQNFFFCCFGRRRGRSYGPEAAQTTPLLHTAGERDSKWSVHYNTQKPQQRLLFFSGKKHSGSSDDLRAFSDDEERFILNNRRPLTPPMLNPAHRSSCWDVFASAYELAEATEAETEAETETEKTTRLPTPEEKMRKQAEAVAADIVPINITGESFDRQASFRKVVSNTDSLSRQTRNLSRCQTLAGIPYDVSEKLDSPTGSLGSPGSAVLTGAGRPAEENPTPPAPAAERGGAREEGKSSVRRIRAPRGGGMCSLMASLTSAPPTDPPPLPLLPRPETNSSLDSCGTLSASSSCCQGFHGDLQPLLPSDLAVSPSPSSSFPSLLVSSSSYLSSSSIADSQLSFQTLQSCDSGDTWNYEPLSPSGSGDHGVHGDWSCIATETRSVSRESVNSSGGSTPFHADTSSLCSEFSAFSNSSLRKHSTSSSSASTTSDSRGIGAARSISLRKSTRPPPPPKRSVSLTQRPSRSKRSAQTFHDPWVPRRNSQSDFICNAGAFFEPLRPDYHTETCALSSPNGGRSNISERETSVSPVAASQRLASPSVQRHQSDNVDNHTETFALSSEHLPPNVSKDQQLRLNLNLERLHSDYHTETSALSSEQQAPNGGLSNVSERETSISSAAASQRLALPSVQSDSVLSSELLAPIASHSKVPKDQQLRLNLNAKTSVVSSSAAVFQRLPSPSSGYSSQSNTPAHGTP
ncbi:hypothetical protein EPR50_G00104360 [Perca flavescens]|uniref:Uncharacterized protein n=1 Tax=Perca flavescens TaxID=8167 RepID=A0A484CWG3_PERFV|nr:hypothetical protein EPR50_G00104360 [Perca flavescens]